MSRSSLLALIVSLNSAVRTKEPPVIPHLCITPYQSASPKSADYSQCCLGKCFLSLKSAAVHDMRRLPFPAWILTIASDEEHQHRICKP